MGWTGFNIPYCFDEKAFIETLFVNHDLLRLQKVGSVWFAAATDLPIIVILTQRYRGEFMYKDMDETMGPAPQYCRCPPTILKLAPPPHNEHAVEFRERSRTWNNRPKPKPGQTIRIPEPAPGWGTDFVHHHRATYRSKTTSRLVRLPAWCRQNLEIIDV